MKNQKFWLLIALILLAILVYWLSADNPTQNILSEKNEVVFERGERVAPSRESEGVGGAHEASIRRKDIKSQDAQGVHETVNRSNSEEFPKKKGGGRKQDNHGLEKSKTHKSETGFTPPLKKEFVNESRSDALLVQFSKELTELRKGARKSRRDARRVFDLLYDCSQDSRGLYPVSIRASCFINAQSLNEENFERFQGDLKRLRAQLPREVLQIVKVLEKK